MSEHKVPTLKEFTSPPRDPDRPVQPLDSPEGIEELKRFAAALITLNHDLNNPLAGIVGYLELAMTGKEPIPPDANEMLKNVQRSAELMEKVIQQLTQAKRRLQSSVDISAIEDGIE